MTITYTWDITELQCEDPDNDNDCDTIKLANCTLTGDDGTNVNTIPIAVPLDIVMVPGEGQTPSDVFALVTEAQIIEAAYHALGTVGIDHMKASIANNLSQLSTPVIQLHSEPLPWVV